MQPTRFEIRGLFGRKEPVRLDLSDRVKIIFGINGSGKTTVLRLLHAVLSGRLHEIRNISFKSVTLSFHDGKKLRVTRITRPDAKPTLSTRSPLALRLQQLSPIGKVEHTSVIAEEVELSERLPLEAIEREIPELTRVGRREWTDAITGDLLTISDVIERYSERVRWLQPSTEIDWYRSLVDKFSVKLIQTQRLITLKADLPKFHSRSGLRYQNTVIEYSERLRACRGSSTRSPGPGAHPRGRPGTVG